MTALIAFLSANWPAVVGVLAAVVTVLAGISRLTKTTKDDRAVDILRRVISFLPGGGVAPKADAPVEEEKDGPESVFK
jgi:hypothetical protein